MKKKMKNKKICIISLFLMLLCSLIAVNYTFLRFTRSNFFYGRDSTTYLSSYVSDEIKFASYVLEGGDS